MFRIVQTIWLNNRRARKVRQVHAGSTPPIAEGNDAAERALLARLELDHVAAAVLRLPEELRVVLMLVCVEGLTYREAAEIAAIHLGRRSASPVARGSRWRHGASAGSLLCWSGGVMRTL